MATFNALDTAASGVTLGRRWMEATSDNVANVDTVRPAGQEPFRARMVLAQTRPGVDGVDVKALVQSSEAPQVVYDPGNPLADGDGYVTRPVVDLSSEMTNMMMASRLYQMNLSVMQQARDSYQSALTLGRR